MTSEQIERLREWHKKEMLSRIQDMMREGGDRYQAMWMLDILLETLSAIFEQKLEYGMISGLTDYWKIYLNGELISDVAEERK